MKKADLIVYFIIVDFILSHLDNVIAFVFEIDAKTLHMFIFYCLTFIRFVILFRFLNYFIHGDPEISKRTKYTLKAYSWIAILFFFLWIVWEYFELIRVAHLT